jgi:asparagine synthase (glutamine-hydrolysing)
VSGIAGGIAFKGERAVGDIRRLSNALAHRGSEKSIWSQGPAALVQRGEGPQSVTIDGELSVVLDGRFHGQPALRQRLQQAGRVTEGLDSSGLFLAAWREWGLACLQSIEGDFSIALWDAQEEVLRLFRDRAGVRPLYFSDQMGQFAFASDAKALLRLDWNPLAFDVESLSEYLSFRYTHAPRTLLKGIQQLPAGQYVRVDAKGSQMYRWVRPVYPEGSTEPPEEGAAVWALENALSRAVTRRMGAGERVGILLSGGSASSAIAAMAVRSNRANPRSYYLALADSDVDEQAFASRAAKLFGTEHRAIHIEAKDYFRALDTVTAGMGRPLTSPATVCEYLLCQRAAREVDVLLTGTGADELLAGQAATRLGRELAKVRLLARTPELGRKLFARAGRLVGRNLLEEGGSPGLSRLVGGSNVFDVDGRLEVLRDPDWVRPGMRHSILAPLYDEVKTDPINEVLHVYSRGWMVEDTLQRADGVGELTGIQVRFPMLDSELIQLCASWPGSAKVKRRGRRWVGRWPLRQLVSRHLPPQLVWRPDRRMPAPLHTWLRGPWEPELKSRVESLCDDPLGLFRADAIQKMAQEHAKGEANHGLRLWTLFFFDAWWRNLS